MFVVEKEKGNAPCDEFCVPGKGIFSERRVLRLRKLFESQGEDSFSHWLSCKISSTRFWMIAHTSSTLFCPAKYAAASSFTTFMIAG